MSNFTPLVTRKYVFQGDNVEVTFARLKRKDVIPLIPMFSDMQSEDEETRREAMPKGVEHMIDILPNYIRSMTGLKDSEGNDLTVDAMCDEVYFLDLAIEIATDVIEESLITEGAKAKNG